MTSPPPLRGRPGLLLSCWFLLLALLATLAPVVQTALGVDWEVLALVMLAPGLAAAAAAQGWAPVAPARMLRPVLPALTFATTYLLVLVALTGRRPVLPTEVAGLPLLLVVGLQALGALGEELGWRGLVQQAGEQLARPVVVVTVAGATFGATHLGYWSLGPVFMAWFSLSSVLMCLAMALTWRGSLAQRLVPATLIHLAVNLSLLAVPVGLGEVPAWALPLPAAAGLAGVLLVDRAAQAVGPRFSTVTGSTSSASGIPKTWA